MAYSVQQSHRGIIESGSMARPIRILLQPFLLLALSCSLFAQDAARTTAPDMPQAATPQAVQINLGESSAELAGPWKFQIGDNPAWSETNYDDSSWGLMDLSPPPGSADTSLGISGYIPGWTVRGYPNHTGFAWYRLKVEVNGADRRLALKMPASADDAYQVFVNGQQIGEFGEFTGHRVAAFSSLPQSFRLQKEIRDGMVTIAIRMWMDSATPFNSPDAGGLHGPPVLGYASVIGALVRLDYDDIAHDLGGGFLETLILIMALVMALALYWLDRQEKAYFWLALVCLATLLGNSIVLAANFVPLIPQTPGVILADVLLAPIRIGLWVLFWGYWFRIWRMPRLHQFVWSLVAILMLGTAMLRPPVYGQLVPVHYASWILPLLLIVKLGLGLLLCGVAYRGIMRQRTEGWMAALAVLLVVISNYQHELRLIHIRTIFPVMGFSLSLGTISTILSLLIITVLLLRRFVLAQRLKEQWKIEIQQARHIQELLIPRKLPKIRGLQIQSEYRPMREVGGDFFQVLPASMPDSVLIVVGDVTGKGLQAGMLVSLIVGAIQSVAQRNSEPAEILNEVNKQLCDHQEASATCLIMRIDSNGKASLANAGHLPPYLNGAEIRIEGSLPIGIVPGSDVATASFELKQNDSLIVMSDGVVEAQDAKGVLFGFQRIDELLLQQATPKEIADKAQTFGQEDDILILEVRRDLSQILQVQVEPQLAAG
ncbi:MAG: SpoIIE family protein phosphatase [Edaphobacter sp.]|uniref:PP2C family protein-serine/threonine phosphatase n=1 Tax=Edaphobacter sp. TaxID=1934404 RepID=UPI00238FD30D|nr:SpoIIE family protein phosphatase [Edaphobacter sp.]MDE1178430.1 SpoIIE family protein phosphatase [Edaphobacter sp.]